MTLLPVYNLSYYMANIFKILSIDGGGIKGLYSSTILEHFEKKYQNSISDYFDMLCGTSTGGLIALALSLKIPATEISKMYSEKGQFIFPKRTKLGGKIRQTFLKGKYSDKPLKIVLKDFFGEKKISESNNLLCIPSYSLTDARPWVFKYDHKEGTLARDNKALYVDVALATSAAPTFFPLAEIGYYDSKQFVDGGVWANNPSLVGLIEALTYFVGEGKAFDSIQILSVSSLNHTGGKPTGLKRERAFIQWKDDLFNTSLVGQSVFTDYFLSKLHTISNVPIEYLRIPSENISAEQQQLIKLDEACKDAINLIRGKGNDRGEIASKDKDIAKFFEVNKTYKI
jgi:hypothetical protein